MNKWGHEWDVLMVGTGAAGMRTAVTAAGEGPLDEPSFGLALLIIGPSSGRSARSARPV